RIINPLKDGLASRLKSVGRIYVLIGPRTFSSASMNAWDLQKNLRAKLVGESSGGSPGGYGEIKLFTLPNSKLTVQYTTKYFSLGDTSLIPDLPVSATLADALNGRDVALEAAIRAN